MVYVLVYKLFQLNLLAVFAVFVSDYRRKSHMAPFGRRGFILVLKFVYLVPLCIYGACLLGLRELTIYDGPALLLTSLGTLVVVKGKRDLGSHHAWTGYRRDHTQVITGGIYSWIRHPIYLGIFLFIAGGICGSVPRISGWLVLAGLSTLAYIVSFLALSARRESQHMMLVYGDAYREYREHVHAFLPIRRYRKAA